MENLRIEWNGQIVENSLYFYAMGVTRDILVRQNLIRIMKERDLKPGQLAKMIKTTPQYMSDILTGKRGLGEVLQDRICEKLNIKLFEFYKEGDLPNVTNEWEQYKLSLFRTESELGIAEEIARYEEYQIDSARIKQGAFSGTREERLEQIGEVLGNYVNQSTMEKIVERMPQLAPILGKKKRERKKKAS